MTELLRNKFEEIEKHIGDNEDNSYNSSDEEDEIDKTHKKLGSMSQKDLLRLLNMMSDATSCELEDYKHIIEKMKAYKAKAIRKQKTIENNCKSLGKIKTMLELKYNHKIE
jgi:hypothetical protein